MSLLTHKISNEKINQWNCLNKDVPREERYDCTINSMTFLDLIERDTAENYAKDINLLKSGVSDTQIVHELHKIFSNESENRSYKIKHLGLDTEWKRKIKNKLGKNDSTVGLFHRQSTIGHAVVLAKNEDNILFIFDPQQQMYYPDVDSIVDKYIKSQKFVNLSLIYNTKTGRKQETTVQLRKKKQLQPSKKQRIGTKEKSSESKPMSHEVLKSKSKSKQTRKTQKVKKSANRLISKFTRKNMVSLFKKSKQ
jgi:hypothetical protein